MAVSTMTWKPDTCDCVIEETHDPADPTYGVRFSRVIKKCPAHAVVQDGNLYGAVHANPDSEQKRKNMLEGMFMEDPALPTGEDKGKNENGDMVRGWKDGVRYRWSFDADRILHVAINGVTLLPGHRTKINQFCDAQFGNGKVVLD